MRDGEDKGKQGHVLKVMRKKNRLVVKGINITKRHVRANQGTKRGENQGGYWYAESPVHYSKLALVDPSTGKACRIRYEFIDGEKVRISKDTAVPIPKPTEFYNSPDRRKREPGPKDTPPSVALKKTFDEETLNPLLMKSVNHKQITIAE